MANEITDEPERVAYLIYNYMHKRLSESESTELIQWLFQSERNKDFFRYITNKDVFKEQLIKYFEYQ